ncbi:N-acetylmuramoyl-L-alanine amidase family protein [Heyndrickxia acidicola]|uniref:N-acetylmuramoyl-L-alanine amidase n=1 Tax=Heyndrickxia acidicola TaxID=209389 RepID=A0ABU6MGX4_9BACI|nr:N-acetylmuramoyl-L-alanine amidase [Heyndrickxia acidicola]MED1203679.1 N-acetylmuramoyl-L-alanine amidase [Heyndrickxia acidicola]
MGTHEKSLTLPTVQAVEQKLEKAGATVIMTRTDNSYIPLQQREDISNQNHADAFISFHYNWSDESSVNGLTDFYYQKSNNPLASDILNEVTKTTGLNNIGKNSMTCMFYETMLNQLQHTLRKSYAQFLQYPYISNL